MSLSVVQKITEQLSGINSEVNQLRDDANQKIGPREIARSFINSHLMQMPEVIQGDHAVSYRDDRGEWGVKQQAKNLSLWVVALQTTIETGHTSYAILRSLFHEWAKDALKVDWPIEQAHNVAKKYVIEMQTFGILSEKANRMTYTNDDGEEKSTIVAELSESFKEMMLAEAEAMKESSSMICKPLENQPQNWIDSVNGIGDNANIPLITRKSYSGNTLSTRVLAAVNKLQAVKFIVSPAIINAAFDILDNQHEYKSTDEELLMYREMIQLENRSMFFPITMDTRGRMYYRGGLLTPQGTDFCKAAFQFAETQPLGERGHIAVKLHVANVFGQDKISLDAREAWVDASWMELMLIRDHHDIAEHFPEADTYQAIVAVKELQAMNAWVNDDNHISTFESNLVCHQDGTCNGLQHMAAITKNRQTAITVNCVESSHSDVPSDIYGIIATAAKEATTGEISTLIAKYGRKMSKNPVMITGYGAGEQTIIRNTSKFLEECEENPLLAEDIGKAYCAAIDSQAGAVKSLTGALKARVKQAIKDGATRFEWETADGFIASTEYRDIECNRVRAGVFNALVRGAFPAPLDDVKTEGAMAPNFIHSIDATHLRMVVNDCQHDLVTVHDSIGSHASNYFNTADSIRTQFVEVHAYDALGNLCDNMGMRTPKFRGDYSPTEALKSTYIFS